MNVGGIYTRFRFYVVSSTWRVRYLEVCRSPVKVFQIRAKLECHNNQSVSSKSRFKIYGSHYQTSATAKVHKKIQVVQEQELEDCSKTQPLE